MRKVQVPIRRIETFDLLRGFLLVIILLNHLHYYPSGFEYITGQSFLYVSAAEGFFLISGIVLGMVRGGKRRDQPFNELVKPLLKRAGQLYLTSIILVIIFTLLGWFFVNQPGVKTGLFLPIGDIWMMLWQTVTLQYTYGWADYLRLYALFLLFSPVALWLLRKGKWYLVLAASFGVWTLYPLSPWPPGWLSAPISWQLIFFAGFVVGYHWQEISRWWKQRLEKTRRIITATIVPLGFLSVVFSALLVFGKDIPEIGASLSAFHGSIEIHFEKDRLPLARIGLSMLWFASFFWIFSRFETQLKKWFGWLLLSFGTNSLYVYTIQAFVVFFVLLATEKSNWWFINFLISVMTIGIVYLAVRTKFLMKIIPR